MKQRITSSYYRLRQTNILSNLFNLGGIQISNMLLLVLLIPVITRLVGFEQFGIIMWANRYMLLAASVVNYGTGQSGVRDVAKYLHDKEELSKVFYRNLFIRMFILLPLIVLLVALSLLHLANFDYVILATPMIAAEAVNPLCFYIGAEKLKRFNLFNLFSNVTVLIIILAFVKGPAQAIWINFILGMANVITYTALLILFILKYKLSFCLPTRSSMLAIGRENFYLTINNISINLQQSLIIFGLKQPGLQILLGPYTLCDRIIAQVRSLLIIISNALYPHTVHIFENERARWKAYRRATKYTLAAVFILGALLLCFLADPIIYIISKQHNELAISLLRIMAWVPVISALNSLNVLDQLVKNNTVQIFRIAIILLIVCVLCMLLLLNVGGYLIIGAFTLIVETFAWLLYEYQVKKTDLQNA